MEEKTILQQIEEGYGDLRGKESHYLSRKEANQITKTNTKIIKQLEARKKRNADESEYVTQMRDPNNIVEFDDLHTYFFTDAGVVKSVDGVSFDIPKGSVVGVVGESGCGKSVTSLSLMQLVQAPQGQLVSGSIRFQTTDFVYGEDGKPLPVYETAKDENGNEILDENGQPVLATRQKLDKKGNPVFDKQGEPVYEYIQAVDKDGFPAFQTQP